jgi:hypothetical protein
MSPARSLLFRGISHTGCTGEMRSGSGKPVDRNRRRAPGDRCDARASSSRRRSTRSCGGLVEVTGGAERNGGGGCAGSGRRFLDERSGFPRGHGATEQAELRRILVRRGIRGGCVAHPSIGSTGRRPSSRQRFSSVHGPLVLGFRESRFPRPDHIIDMSSPPRADRHPRAVRAWPPFRAAAVRACSRACAAISSCAWSREQHPLVVPSGIFRE